MGECFGHIKNRGKKPSRKRHYCLLILPDENENSCICFGFIFLFFIYCYYFYVCFVLFTLVRLFMQMKILNYQLLLFCIFARLCVLVHYNLNWLTTAVEFDDYHAEWIMKYQNQTKTKKML